MAVVRVGKIAAPVPVRTSRIWGLLVSVGIGVGSGCLSWVVF